MGQDKRQAELLEIIHSGDWEAQRDAVSELVKMGAAIIPAMIRILSSYPTWEAYEESNPNSPHSSAEDVLIKLERESIPMLLPLLNEENWGARFGAIYCLGRIGEDTAVDPLISILQHDDVNIHTDVADALIRIGEGAFQRALDLLHHENAVVRRGLAFTLGEFGDLRAVPPLTDLMEHDPVQDVQQAAAAALETIGSRDALDAIQRWRQKDS